MWRRPSLVFHRSIKGVRRSPLQFVVLRLVVAADKPKYDSEGQSCSGERSNHARRCLIKIENDEPANQCEQGDQDNGANLHDGASMMFDDQQCVLELECDEHGKHHAEDALEDLGIGRIDHMASDELKGVEN